MTEGKLKAKDVAAMYGILAALALEESEMGRRCRDAEGAGLGAAEKKHRQKTSPSGVVRSKEGKSRTRTLGVAP